MEKKSQVLVSAPLENFVAVQISLALDILHLSLGCLEVAEHSLCEYLNQVDAQQEKEPSHKLFKEEKKRVTLYLTLLKDLSRRLESDDFLNSKAFVE